MNTTWASGSSDHHYRWHLIAVITIAAVATIARADVAKISLPGDYADFALDPATGNIVALSAETNEAVLLRRDAMRTGRIEPAKKLRVGSTPCSIRYKQFGKLRVFAVVCSLDSHMYLIDANDFSLISKIELSQRGVSHVTSSINPDDPFVYYNYGSGHDSAAGVVSLRDMKNHGVAFANSMDCAVSASGEIAYRRGPFSPSGFESLLRTNRLTDDAPTFTSLFRDHKSRGEYVPDPFDERTAAGTSIFSRGLEKLQVGLDFTPSCFFRERPVIVGIETTSPHDRARRQGQSSTVTVRAASYNTLSRIGDDITLNLDKIEGDGALPRGVQSQADFKRLAKRTRMFADDARSQVVYAHRNTLFLIPLADFNLPDEAFLRATLEGPRHLHVGKSYDLAVKVTDPRVKATLVDQPDGVRVDGTDLHWTPALEQVGPAHFAVMLEHNDIQRTIRIQRAVTFPSIELPIVAGGLAVADSGRLAVVWEGVPRDPHGRPSPFDGSTSVAVIDLDDGQVIASREVLDPIQQAIVTDTHVVMQMSSSTLKCEVLTVRDLQREKTIVANASITRIEALNKHLVLLTTSGIEVYDARSFRRVKVLGGGSGYGRPSRPENGPFTNYGLLVNFILYDKDLNPQLLISHGGIPTLSGVSQGLVLPTSLEVIRPKAPQRRPSQQQGLRQIATRSVPGTNTEVSLHLVSERTQTPGSTGTWHNRREVVLVASGHVNHRQVLVRQQVPSGVKKPVPLLDTTGRTAIVVDGDELYKWPIPEVAESQTKPLEMAPRQSALSLDDSGTTELRHDVRGGAKPYHFSLRTPLSQLMTIDHTTGKVTIDNEKARIEALRTLVVKFRGSRGATSLASRLEQHAMKIRDRCTELLGRDPMGHAVAIPVHIEVSDSNLASQTMQYFVVAELPAAVVHERFTALEQERSAERAKATEQKTPSSESTDLDEVSRRLAALEQTVQLLTRQMNQLLERLKNDDG